MGSLADKLAYEEMIAGSGRKVEEDKRVLFLKGHAMREEVMLFVILNHWGEYDYSGTEVVGIYRDRADAETKKARLELEHTVEARSNEYTDPCHFTIVEKRAVI